MRTDTEYKKTLQEKYERALLERKIARKNTITSVFTAFFSIVFVISAVFLSSTLSRGNFTKEIFIFENGDIIRHYTDKNVVAEVSLLLGELTETGSDEAKNGETLFTVKICMSDGSEKISYYAEADDKVGIESVGSEKSIRFILGKYD